MKAFDSGQWDFQVYSPYAGGNSSISKTEKGLILNLLLKDGNETHVILFYRKSRKEVSTV